jgi:PleD family two-component response regulator
MFWFTFPYRPDEEAAKVASAENFEGIGDGNITAIECTLNGRRDSDPLPQRRILLIDDSPSVLRVTSRFLVMNGHTVTTAPNGWAGLEILKSTYAKQPFDLVMTDMQMPGM